MKKLQVNLIKQPAQQRAKFTVNVIKEAAAHILKEQGYEFFTTNKVAERAGVSIGSLYQYFPSKEALVAEIKRDHFIDIRHLMLSAYQQTLNEPLEEVNRQLVLAAIAGHMIDPELHRILSHDIPELTVKEDNNEKDSIRLLVIQLLEERKNELRADLNIPLAARLINKTVEHLAHEAVLFEPELLAAENFSEELVRFITAYLTMPVMD